MSIKPGQSGFVTIDPAIGGTTSSNLNPLSPVEFGRTVSGGVADDWSAGTTPGTITIGTVSIIGSASQTVGTGSTYSATISGNAADAVYAWTTDDASATISASTASSTDIQFSTSGNFTVTCTVTSATSSPTLVSGTKAVSATAVPLAIALTSTDFTEGNSLPDDVGSSFTGQSPTSPALAWSLSGTNAADVASYQLRVADTSNGNYLHWTVDNIGTAVVSIAAGAAWGGSPTINTTGAGVPQAMLANGWEPCAPPGGSTHTYRFQIQGIDSNGNSLVTSNLLTGTYTG